MAPRRPGKTFESDYGKARGSGKAVKPAAESHAGSDSGEKRANTRDRNLDLEDRKGFAGAGGGCRWTSPLNFKPSTTPEVNIEVGWLWDGGITVRLGYEMNGFLAEETVPTIADVLPWLQEAIAHFYPDSTYAKRLDEDLRERASQRLFLPPRVGAQGTCPHCGAPNAGPASVLTNVWNPIYENARRWRNDR